MTLTTDQQKAYDEIMASLSDKSNPRHVLKGYAGTGKTYLTEYVAKNFGNVVVAAPTNKAAKVIQDMTGFSASTLAKMLNLRLERGKLIQMGTPSFEGSDLIIIDECSMIGRRYFDLIHKFVPSSTPILFVGDPAQLPPIGEKHSKVFDLPNQSMLTDVVRQKGGNPIIGFSVQLRSRVFNMTDIPFDNDHIRKMNGEQVIPLALKASKSNSVVAAWTNRTCQYVNFGAHKLAFGNDSMDFVPGEEIVFQEPLIDADKAILLNNSDITTVRSCKEGYMTDESLAFGKHRFKTWEIETKEGYVFSSVQEGDRARFKMLLEQYDTAGLDDRRWMLKEREVDVRHTYAMTCHKLQGSTYDNVLVACRDIVANRNKKEMTQCMYVAITRASNRLGMFV